MENGLSRGDIRKQFIFMASLKTKLLSKTKTNKNDLSKQSIQK